MPGSGSNPISRTELLIELRRNAPTALHRQVGAAIRHSIRTGRLAAGATLPASRTLAGDLGVSRGVVVEAYQQLAAEGYLVSRPGGYTQVAPGAQPAPPRRPAEPARQLRIDFRYGRPDVSAFPRGAWLRSLRTVLAHTPNERLVYLDGRGAPELRAALAEYLNRSRGTAADAENILIVNGFAQGLGLIASILADAGARTLAVGNPSPDDDRAIGVSAGLAVVGVPVDENGMRIPVLEASGAEAALVTAAHQFPVGGALPAAARSALIEWATRHDAVIIEDDYDAEYRYDRAPVGAMQGLAPERVIYAGSASKTLAPGLRLGWVLAPDRFVDPLAAAKLFADRGSPVLDQLAFADFLARGEFDRHLRRMRPIYRRRHDTLLGALAHRLPDLRPTGDAAGLHLVALLPPDVDEQTVVAAAAERGVGVYGIAPYRLTPGPPGLLFGYAALSERDIIAGVDILADVFAQRPSVRPNRSVRAASLARAVSASVT
jgi:GntR family transcriptional regulator / MocR family aminotransferase